MNYEYKPIRWAYAGGGTCDPEEGGWYLVIISHWLYLHFNRYINAVKTKTFLMQNLKKHWYQCIFFFPEFSTKSRVAMLTWKVINRMRWSPLVLYEDGSISLITNTLVENWRQVPLQFLLQLDRFLKLH